MVIGQKMRYNTETKGGDCCQREIFKRRVEGLFMKKFFALLLLMMAMLLTGAAVAEAPFEGVWMQYDAGFEILLPSDWVQYEVPEDYAAEGIFDIFASADGAFVVTAAWTALEAPATMQELQAAFVGSYPDAEVIEYNGIEFLIYSDEANDTMCISALDGVDLGLYIFTFTGMQTDADIEIATAIATSIRNIE